VDTVAAAGGWMCDRVLGGWLVRVIVTGPSDVLALHVLGVQAITFTQYLQSHPEQPTALALDSAALDDDRVLENAYGALTHDTELTVWGEIACAGVEDHPEPVMYRPSKAAAMFKAHALALIEHAESAVDQTERFRSCGLSYPPHGADLIPAPLH